jgi:hypothetical protein
MFNPVLKSVVTPKTHQGIWYKKPQEAYVEVALQIRWLGF